MFLCHVVLLVLIHVANIKNIARNESVKNVKKNAAVKSKSRGGVIIVVKNKNYLMNNSSLYLGRGHISSSTISSRLSTLSRITSKNGSTVSW